MRIQVHGDVDIVGYDRVIWDEEEIEWLGDRETKEGEPMLALAHG